MAHELRVFAMEKQVDEAAAIVDANVLSSSSMLLGRVEECLKSQNFRELR